MIYCNHCGLKSMKLKPYKNRCPKCDGWRIIDGWEMIRISMGAVLGSLAANYFLFICR